MGKLKKFRAENNSLALLLNMDQTSTQEVPAERRTIEKQGKKQVTIACPAGEKNCFTLTLTIGADGRKFPAIIVFKTASKNEKIPPYVLKRLKIPKNVIVTASKSGWWTGPLDKEYTEIMFPEKQPETVFLMRDHAPVHTTKAAAAELGKKNVTQIFVPGSRTGEFQPLDAAVNRAFKVAYQGKYHQWMLSENHAITKAGNKKSPSKQQLINWVSEAWDEVTMECVLASWKEACWKHIEIPGEGQEQE